MMHIDPETTVLDVVVVSDVPPGEIAPLKQSIETSGFQNIEVRQAPATDRSRFEVVCKGCAHPRLDDQVSILRRCLEHYAKDRGVDTGRFPAEIRRDGDAPLTAMLSVPLRRLALGDLRPYAEQCPERHRVLIRTDAKGPAIDLLIRRLVALGFEGISTVEVEPDGLKYRISWAGLEMLPALAKRLRETVRAVMRELNIPSSYRLRARRAKPDAGEHDVVIDFLSPEVACQKRKEEAPRLEQFDVKIISTRPMSKLRPLIIALNKLFQSCKVEHHGVSDDVPVIRYGGAPPKVIARVERLVGRYLGTDTEVVATRVWDESDNDIYISLPEAQEETAPRKDTPFDVQMWLALTVPSQRAQSRKPARFVERRGDTVRIGSVLLPVRPGARSAWVPALDRFRFFCVDQKTAEVLQFVAQSAVLDEFCMLEGPTATSKSSAIAFVASQTNTPLLASVLSSQTDVGDLVGRFGPNTRKNARTAWRWLDGVITTAAREGAWCVLEEINLAPASIVERLNSLLDFPPYLILTEHAGELVTPASSFRLFATRNAASYEGRAPLSPAAMSRWRAYLQVPAAEEEEYFQFLRLVVHGEQPAVSVDGKTYAGFQQAEPLAELANVPGMDSFLETLARFHHALEKACATGDRLGSGRREPYVFSRRTLAAVVGFLAAAGRAGDTFELACGRALVRYYFSRVSPTDRPIVAQIAAGVGLGPDWEPVGEAVSHEDQDEDRDVMF